MYVMVCVIFGIYFASEIGHRNELKSWRFER